MRDRTDTAFIANREFISLVRAQLDARGQSEVIVECNWIEEETFGGPWLLNVPVGIEFSIPLKRSDHLYNEPASALESHVDYFASALINLHQAEKALVKYAHDVRRAANALLAAARATGLDLLLRVSDSTLSTPPIFRSATGRTPPRARSLRSRSNACRAIYADHSKDLRRACGGHRGRDASDPDGPARASGPAERHGCRMNRCRIRSGNA